MTFLYSLPNCPACALAKDILNKENEEYREIPIVDPVSKIGMLGIFKKLEAPYLYREKDNAFFRLGRFQDGSYKFVKILMKNTPEIPEH